MSKGIMLVAGVVVLAVLGGGIFYVTNKDETPDQATSSQTGGSSTNQNKTSDDSKVEGNLASISSGGKARQCTFTYSGENGSGNGSLYTDGNGRGLMTMDLVTEKGNTGKSNTLITSDKAYSWTTTNGTSIGFVFDKEKLTANTSQTSNTTSSDANKNFSMNCEDWTVDNSKLNAPSDVNFSTLPS